MATRRQYQKKKDTRNTIIHYNTPIQQYYKSKHPEYPEYTEKEEYEDGTWYYKVKCK